MPCRFSMSKNIEIKARSNNHDYVRNILKNNQADFKGTDHQIDTYFNVPDGRLKLREGTIENRLIFYKRNDQPGPKQSDFILFATDKENSPKEILTTSLGVKVIVDKQREIYFIDNVKFHIDTVTGLGDFVEIEVIDYEGNMPIDDMTSVCNKYMELFKIPKDDLLSVSYSDLLLQQN